MKSTGQLSAFQIESKLLLILVQLNMTASLFQIDVRFNNAINIVDEITGSSYW